MSIIVRSLNKYSSNKNRIHVALMFAKQQIISFVHLFVLSYILTYLEPLLKIRSGSYGQSNFSMKAQICLYCNISG